MVKRKKPDRRPNGIPLDGDAVAQHRKLNKMTQEELAEKSGIPLRTLQRIEAGDPTTPIFLDYLASALNVPKYFLLPNRPEAITPPSGSQGRERVLFRCGLCEFEFPITLDEFLAKGYHIRLYSDFANNGYINDGVDRPGAVAGSIQVQGWITKRDALRLTKAFLRGDLHSFGVRSVALAAPGVPLPEASNLGDTNHGTHSSAEDQSRIPTSLERARQPDFGALGRQSSIPELVTKLQSSNKDVRAASALELAQRGSPTESLSALVRITNDSDAYVRRCAYMALGNTSDREQATQFLIPALVDPSDTVRHGAAQALERIGPSANKALPHLVQALAADPDEGVRAALVLALGRIGDSPEVAHALAKALADPNDIVRVCAAHSILNVRTTAPDTIQALIRATKDEDINTRALAAVALGRLGPDARDAVPVLSQMLEDPKIFIRVHAAVAIESITAPSPAADSALRTRVESLQSSFAPPNTVRDPYQSTAATPGHDRN